MCDPKHKVRDQRRGSNSMLFLTTWSKRNHQRQGKEVPSWLLNQQGESETHKESLSSASGKSEASQEAEPQ